MTPILVIGGGAAGMIAAWRAAQRGVPVTLLEKKNRLGTKILISGGGKCNLTHAGTMDSIRQKFRPHEGRFLRPSFFRFTNEDYLRLLIEKGMECVHAARWTHLPRFRPPTPKTWSPL